MSSLEKKAGSLEGKLETLNRDGCAPPPPPRAFLLGYLVRMLRGGGRGTSWSMIIYLLRV